MCTDAFLFTVTSRTSLGLSTSHGIYAAVSLMANKVDLAPSHSYLVRDAYGQGNVAILATQEELEAHSTQN
jgi:ApbE superfamily uncharacterized protein (UPF0280 family)